MFMRSKRGWPVVDGQPVRPYALPEDPARTATALREMGEAARRREDRHATRLQRMLHAVGHQVASARRGRGFVVTVFGRYTLEFRRRVTGSEEQEFTAQLGRRMRWNISLEFWRSL